MSEHDVAAQVAAAIDEQLPALLAAIPGIVAGTLEQHVAGLRIIDTEQAAAFLSLTPDSMERMRHRREGPSWIELSQRRVGYRIADLAAWLESRKRP